MYLLTPRPANPIVQEPRTLRSVLRTELLRRLRRDPGYSLRAFAVSLETEPSVLSKILSGKRQVSARMFDHLAKGLALAPAEVARMRGLLEPLRRSEKRQHSESSMVSEYRQLSLDLFRVISDWYHYAILEVTRVEGFRSDARWMARALGIRVIEVRAALGRLQRLGMLKCDEKGRWIDQSGAVTHVTAGRTSVVQRKFQRQILELGLRALAEVLIGERDHTSMTMAIDSRRLPVARERIKSFRRELCELLQPNPLGKRRGKRDRVYHLGVALYPVSRN